MKEMNLRSRRLSEVVEEFWPRQDLYVVCLKEYFISVFRGRRGKKSIHAPLKRQASR